MEIIKFKPKNLIELEVIAQLALYTDEGTVLVKNGEMLNIGDVELPVSKRIEEIKEDIIYTWVESEKELIETLLLYHESFFCQ